MKQKIVEATGYFIERYGLRKFTMDEIAHHLGISKKTVYQYFTSKQELITAYFQYVYEEDKKRTKAIIEDAKKDLNEKVYQVVSSYENHHITMNVSAEAKQRFPIQWEQLEQIRQTKIEALTVLFTLAAEENRIRKPYTKELIVAIVDQWSQIIIQPNISEQYGDISTREMAIAFVDIMLNGCLVSTIKE